jgi:hypothetical protein
MRGDGKQGVSLHGHVGGTRMATHDLAFEADRGSPHRAPAVL